MAVVAGGGDGGELTVEGEGEDAGGVDFIGVGAETGDFTDGEGDGEATFGDTVGECDGADAGD